MGCHLLICMNMNLKLISIYYCSHFTTFLDCDCYMLPLLTWENTMPGKKIIGKCDNSKVGLESHTFDIDKMNTFSHCQQIRRARQAGKIIHVGFRHSTYLYLVSDKFLKFHAVIMMLIYS